MPRTKKFWGPLSYLNKKKKAAPKKKKSVSGRIGRAVAKSVAKSISTKPSASGPWHKGLATTGGAALGGLLGGPAGAAIGGIAGKIFSGITGFGDYKIKKNSLLHGSSPPMFANGQRANVIEHREFIGDVVGSVSFQNTSFAINPGLFASYPWLAQVAANYEQYRINGMVYEFKSTAGDAISSTNNALGTVIMATEYNSTNPSFASKAEMENYQFCTSSKPSVSFMHPIECSRGESTLTELYIRTGAVQTGQDKRFSDFGNFQIATQGMQADGITVGELWVTYSVTLLKPRIPNILSELPLMDHYSFTSSEVSSIGGSNPFGTTPSTSVPKLPQPGGTIGTMITSANSIQFPGYPSNPAPFISGDRFMLIYLIRGPGGTTWTTPLTFTLGAAFNAVNLIDKDTTSVFNISATTVTTDSIGIRCIVRNSTVASLATQLIVSVAGTLPSAGTVVNCDLFILSLNEGSTLLETYDRRFKGQGKGVIANGFTSKPIEPPKCIGDSELLKQLVDAIKNPSSLSLVPSEKEESKEEKVEYYDEEDLKKSVETMSLEDAKSLLLELNKKFSTPPKENKEEKKPEKGDSSKGWFG